MAGLWRWRGEKRAAMSADFEHALKQEVLRTELIRVKALIGTAALLTVMLWTVYVLDPNMLSPDGATALMAFAPSPDARLLAYTLAQGGADWQTVHVADIQGRRDLDDRVCWMRFSELAWTHDSQGFFYSRFPEPPPGKALEAALANHALYYHRLGTPQDEDRLVFARPDLPSWFISGTVSDDGRYLLIGLFEGATNSNRLYFADLGDPDRPDVTSPVRPVVEQDEDAGEERRTA